MTIQHKREALILSAVSCVLLSGAACEWCVSLGDIPADLPPEIAIVIQNESRFAQQGTEVLADVDVGEVADDLGMLSGCWGAHYHFTFIGLPFCGYEAYSFDPASGKARYFVLQGGVATSVQEFTFSVVANDRIRIRRRLRDGTEREVDVLMTLRGSELKLAYMSQDGNFLDGSSGDPEDGRVALVFRAFDCP